MTLWLQEEAFRTGWRCGADQGAGGSNPSQASSVHFLLSFPKWPSLTDQIPSFSCPVCQAHGTWGQLRCPHPGNVGKGTGPSLLRVCEQSPEIGSTGYTGVASESAPSEGGDRALFGKRPGLMEEIRSAPLASRPPDVRAQPLPWGKRFSRTIG